MAYTKNTWTEALAITHDRLNNLETQYDEAVAEGENLRKDSSKELRLHVAASHPGSPVTGQIYFNTAQQLVYLYNGAAWVPAAGSELDITFAGGSRSSKIYKYLGGIRIGETNDLNATTAVTDIIYGGGFVWAVSDEKIYRIDPYSMAVWATVYSTHKVRKIVYSDTDDYLYALVITIPGDAPTLAKIDPSDFSTTTLATSPGGGNPYAIIEKGDHVFITTASTNQRVYKYNKSNLSYVAQSAQYGSIYVWALAKDDDYIYMSGSTMWRASPPPDGNFARLFRINPSTMATILNVHDYADGTPGSHGVFVITPDPNNGLIHLAVRTGVPGYLQFANYSNLTNMGSWTGIWASGPPPNMILHNGYLYAGGNVATAGAISTINTVNPNSPFYPGTVTYQSLGQPWSSQSGSASVAVATLKEFDPRVL